MESFWLIRAQRLTLVFGHLDARESANRIKRCVGIYS